MSKEVYKKYGLAKELMKHVGLGDSSKRLLHIELSPQDWLRLGPL